MPVTKFHWTGPLWGRRRVIKTTMERAVKWKLLPPGRNPVDGVEPPHVPDKEAEFLTVDESNGLVEVLEGTEHELPILVGLYCGLRPAEYLGLRWRDVDLERGELRVTQTVHRVRLDYVTKHMGQEVHGFRFGPAKTHRSRRPVSIPAPVVTLLLREWRAAQAKQRQDAGDGWTELDLVFTDARGYPHVNERVRNSFYGVLKAAGVRKVVLYALRHTSATIALAKTKDLKLVASRLGHTSELLVLRTYSHLLPGTDRAAADLMAEAVRREGWHTNGTSED